MVEGGAKQLSEDVMLDALFTAHEALQQLLDLQDELQKALGKPKRAVDATERRRGALQALPRTAATPRSRPPSK